MSTINMAQAANRGVSRILTKLKVSIQEGNYYEAHQMYRTLYFRYCGQKKYVEVLNLLYDGASLLLSHDQQSSGADLALLMLDVLEVSKAEPNDENIYKIANLFQMLHCTTPERHQYLVKAVKWSTGDSFNQGHPKLHESLAQILWKEKNFTYARYHFLRSCDGLGCGMMLIELHLLRGYTTEVDLFLAQAVFQYLCLHKKGEASDVFKSYTTKHPTIKQQKYPFLLPLLNFLWLLLTTVESGTVTHFTILCEEYRPSLKRDPMYIEYLDKIGQVFFNIPPPRETPSSGGIFGNLLQGLLGDLANESDEEMLGSSSHPLASEDLD